MTPKAPWFNNSFFLISSDSEYADDITDTVGILQCVRFVEDVKKVHTFTQRLNGWMR